MNIYDVVIIGVALAMDAFGVTLGIGINPILNKEHKIKFILSFAFFQFLFTYAGGILGYLFDTYIAKISSISGGIIISIVGILVIIDNLKEKENEILRLEVINIPVLDIFITSTLSFCSFFCILCTTVINLLLLN